MTSSRFTIFFLVRNCLVRSFPERFSIAFLYKIIIKAHVYKIWANFHLVLKHVQKFSTCNSRDLKIETSPTLQIWKVVLHVRFLGARGALLNAHNFSSLKDTNFWIAASESPQLVLSPHQISPQIDQYFGCNLNFKSKNAYVTIRVGIIVQSI